MSNIRIVALDLDGTLLNHKNEVSPATRQAIAQAVEQGVVVLPATGRALANLPAEVAQLPGIRLDRPGRVIGKNTVDCMRSGIMYGTAAMLDGMLDRVEEELGSRATVVATGGMAQFIVHLCRREIKLEKDLLLKGLNIIYQKNAAKRGGR